MNTSDIVISPHKLIKTENGHQCSLCDRTWKGKPRKDDCLGAPKVKMRPSEIERLKNLKDRATKYL